MTGASKNTVTKLVVDAGRACLDYQNRTFVNLTCKRIQVDEIWSFVYAKALNAPIEKKIAGQAGDVDIPVAGQRQPMPGTLHGAENLARRDVDAHDPPRQRVVRQVLFSGRSVTPLFVHHVH